MGNCVEDYDGNRKPPKPADKADRDALPTRGVGSKDMLDARPVFRRNSAGERTKHDPEGG